MERQFDAILVLNIRTTLLIILFLANLFEEILAFFGDSRKLRERESASLLMRDKEENGLHRQVGYCHGDTQEYPAPS